MKILILSDLHGKNQIPIGKMASGCDAILILGDVTPEDFVSLERVKVPKIGVHGNWDAVKPGRPDWYDEFSIVNAHLRVCEVNGIRIGGFDGNMKYALAEKFSSADNPVWEEAKRELDTLTEFPAVDIFISHYPPATANDDISDASLDGVQAIRNYIDRIQPRYHLHGHRHENKTVNLGKTVSRCVYPSIVMEI